jgi:hypothetical protein
MQFLLFMEFRAREAGTWRKSDIQPRVAPSASYGSFYRKGPHTACRMARFDDSKLMSAKQTI